MSEIMRIENWCGHEIRFIERDGEWWAILKDICDALNLKTFKISQRLDPDMLIRIPVETERNRPAKYKENYDIPSKYTVNSTSTVHMLAVNEIGIYEALYASRRLEARKFRRWSASVMKKLRRDVGLEGYEVMRMTEPEIQDTIDSILDNLFYDPKTGVLMESVTVAGGDVEQVPYLSEEDE
ncbi:MAG: hypothetical protein J6B01_04950 [Ruminococcus sp.]|nr:hypothetical protein [Ruminococcus sp.]MBO5319139.1 hypothetical protein [Ruminococcus sp.]